MTTLQPIDPVTTAIDDLTLAEVDVKLNEYQQILHVLLQSPGGLFSHLAQHASAFGDTASGSPVQTTPKTAEQLFEQATLCTEQQQLHQAAALFCRAAYTGHLQAQLQLGHCYLKGAGVPKSAVFAYSWFILAALQQDSAAEQACTVLCKHLTPIDQQHAQQLAAERFEKITLQNNK